MRKIFIITAILYAVVGNALAEEKGISSQLPHSSDIAVEQGDRPQRPPAHAPSGFNSAMLTQTEVVRLAKSAAKKGRKLDEYDLRSIIFDPMNREWTVSFDPKPPRRASEECLLVNVKDDSGETSVLRC